MPSSWDTGRKKDFWGICGLLHDVDFEQYPEEHCKKAVELLQQENVEPEVIHAVCSHGFGHCSDVEPEHEMEKVLFACDELTGLIWAAAKMRPSGSVSDMELKSLKKKFKDKRFAAGCSREINYRRRRETGMAAGGSDGTYDSGDAFL